MRAIRNPPELTWRKLVRTPKYVRRTYIGAIPQDLLHTIGQYTATALYCDFEHYTIRREPADDATRKLLYVYGSRRVYAYGPTLQITQGGCTLAKADVARELREYTNSAGPCTINPNQHVISAYNAAGKIVYNYDLQIIHRIMHPAELHAGRVVHSTKGSYDVVTERRTQVRDAVVVHRHFVLAKNDPPSVRGKLGYRIKFPITYKTIMVYRHREYTVHSGKRTTVYETFASRLRVNNNLVAILTSAYTGDELCRIEFGTACATASEGFAYNSYSIIANGQVLNADFAVLSRPVLRPTRRELANL